MHILHPVMVLCGINCSFSFFATVSLPFFGMQCTGLTHSGIQQFDNLLLHHITHSMAQPSLMLYDRLVLLLELYTMCAKSGANTFQVINRVADHLFVLLQ